MGSVDFRLVVPPPDLARDVECLRLARQNNPSPLEIRTCAAGFPGLVFHRAGSGPGIVRIATRSREGTNFPPLFLHGPGFEPSVMTFAAGEVFTLQAVFKPHALTTIFGLVASDLAERVLGSSELGAEALATPLASGSDDERVEAVWDYLRGRQALAGPRDELVERALELIHRRFASVPSLVRALNLSERQLERRFVRVVGFTPLRYLRVRRINEALRLMTTGRFERLADVAAELEFYDQSHFIRDMKEFSWLTPTALTQSVSEFRLDQTGASYQ